MSWTAVAAADMRDRSDYDTAPLSIVRKKTSTNLSEAGKGDISGVCLIGKNQAERVSARCAHTGSQPSAIINNALPNPTHM